MKFTIAAATLALIGASSAAQITSTNNCKTSIFIKPDGQGFNAPVTEIRPGTSYTINLETSRQGNAVKYSNNKNDFTKPISFDYSVTNGVNYYDVSNASGQPFALVAQDAQGGNGAAATVGCPTPACKQVKTASSSRSFNVRAC